MRHFIAAITTAGTLTIGLAAVYYAAAISSDDPGGTFMPFLVPILALMLAVGTTLLVVMPAWAVVEWLRTRHDVPPRFTWTMAGVLAFAACGLFQSGSGSIGTAAIESAYIFLGFMIYVAIYRVFRYL